jgi:hypothetical protein
VKKLERQNFVAFKVSVAANFERAAICLPGCFSLDISRLTELRHIGRLSKPGSSQRHSLFHGNHPPQLLRPLSRRFLKKQILHYAIRAHSRQAVK